MTTQAQRLKNMSPLLDECQATPNQLMKMEIQQKVNYHLIRSMIVTLSPEDFFSQKLLQYVTAVANEGQGILVVDYLHNGQSQGQSETAKNLLSNQIQQRLKNISKNIFPQVNMKSKVLKLDGKECSGIFVQQMRNPGEKNEHLRLHFQIQGNNKYKSWMFKVRRDIESITQPNEVEKIKISDFMKKIAGSIKKPFKPKLEIDFGPSSQILNKFRNILNESLFISKKYQTLIIFHNDKKLPIIEKLASKISIFENLVTLNPIITSPHLVMSLLSHNFTFQILNTIQRQLNLSGNNITLFYLRKGFTCFEIKNNQLDGSHQKFIEQNYLRLYSKQLPINQKSGLTIINVSSIEEVATMKMLLEELGIKSFLRKIKK